jgi:MraZ protein
VLVGRNRERVLPLRHLKAATMAEHRTRFVGNYEHGLDEKGRMVLPAKIRAQLGEVGLLGKLDGCLGLWTIDGFFETADRLQAEIDSGSGRVTQGALRQFTAGVVEVTPDQQGRIVIPTRLRAYAHLGSEVVVTGRIQRAEIWDAQAWASMSDTQDAELTSAVQALGL